MTPVGPEALPGAARAPFAVILAFVILVFQGFGAARSGAQQEASAIQSVVKAASLLPAANREDLQANMLCYARAVISLDWPAMRNGGSSLRVDDLAASIDDTLGRMSLTDPVQRIALANLLTEANVAQQGRDGRLTEAADRVPQPVWIVLLLAGAAVLLYVLLFADRRERFLGQAVMIGSVTIVTIVTIEGLLLIYFLSHPYTGQPGSIKPVAMQETLEVIQHDPVFVGGGLPVRCDAQGRPLGAR